MGKMKSKLYTAGSNIETEPVKRKSKSIRSKITSSYLLIYMFISFTMMLVLLAGTLYITYRITDAVAYEFMDYVAEDFDNFQQPNNLNYNEDYFIEYWIVDKKTDEVLAKKSDYVELDKSKFTQKREKIISNAIKHKALIHYYHSETMIGERKCEFYIAVDGIPVLDEAGVYLVTLLIIIIVFLFLGFFIMLIFGTYNTQRYLSPLKDISHLSKQINSDNLNMRLDVQSARYELKEMVMTINNMLDRIQIGYLKQKQFVSDVSHELRTPISIIGGYANMLKRWAKDDEKVFDESLEAIIDETQSMKNVVENLLLLARYDNKTLVLDKSKYSLSEQLDEMYKELMLLNNNKHVIEIEADPDVDLFGDKIKIRQAIREFCKNAVKYTPVQGKITLSLRKSRNKAIIHVKDTGIGIARKDIGRIFERFYRADRARNRTEEGYGLGLSIARAIIVAHKGLISVKSKDGVGTEIMITIPLNYKD